jgi:hypothetical protein
MATATAALPKPGRPAPPVTVAGSSEIVKPSKAVQRLIEIAECGDVVHMTAPLASMIGLTKEFCGTGAWHREGFGIARSLCHVGKAGPDRIQMEVVSPVGRRDDRRIKQDWLPFISTKSVAKWLRDEVLTTILESRGVPVLCLIDQECWTPGDEVPPLPGAGCVLLSYAEPGDGIRFEVYNAAKAGAK